MLSEQVEHWLRKANPDIDNCFDIAADPKKLAAFIKKEGVDRAVVLAEDSHVTGVVPNDYVLDFAARSKGVLLPFVSIHPVRERRSAHIFKDLLAAGAKGLKLYPTYQHFAPNDPAVYPLYAVAEEYKVPVMFHTGSSVFQGSRLKYGDPLYIDDICVDFPELRVVMAHGGRGFWWERAFFLARLHPHLFLEVAGIPPENLLQYYPRIEKIADKVIFGSDWPEIPSIKANVQGIRELPLKPGTKERILWKNAARLLGLR